MPDASAHSQRDSEPAAATLLVIGYMLIRRGSRERHKQVMLAALECRAAFLIFSTPTPREGTGEGEIV